MPPVDRRNPIRAASSESTCNVLEFFREFPDDETCLEFIWRSRFAEDGSHARCDRCETERVFKRYRLYLKELDSQQLLDQIGRPFEVDVFRPIPKTPEAKK